MPTITSPMNTASTSTSTSQPYRDSRYPVISREDREAMKTARRNAQSPTPALRAAYQEFSSSNVNR